MLKNLEEEAFALGENVALRSLAGPTSIRSQPGNLRSSLGEVGCRSVISTGDESLDVVPG